MKIGVPKEIKVAEYRVGLRPDQVKELVDLKHEVFVQTQAGIEVGFSDADYEKAGGKILTSLKEVYQKTDLIVKVKEPIEQEWSYIKPYQFIYAFFHLAADKKLTQSLMQQQATCFAYETIEDKKGLLPLLIPMSEVAGRMAVQVGMRFLQKDFKGKGLLLGAVPGVKKGSVVILGAGAAGMNALKMAYGLGAKVTLIDISMEKLAYVEDLYQGQVQTLYSNEKNIFESVQQADLVVGAVLIKGALAPKLVTKKMIQEMEKKSVLVDISIDQGGCFETSKITTHNEPIHEVEGIYHYGVTNMPGAVPKTSTYALTNVTFPILKRILKEGVDSIKKDPLLKKGFNIFQGKLVYEQVAKDLDLELSSF